MEEGHAVINFSSAAGFEAERRGGKLGGGKSKASNKPGLSEPRDRKIEGEGS